MMVNVRTPFDRRSLRCRKLFARCPRPNFKPTLPIQKPHLPTARKTVLGHGPIEHVATSGYPTRGIAGVSEAQFGVAANLGAEGRADLIPSGIRIVTAGCKLFYSNRRTFRRNGRQPATASILRAPPSDPSVFDCRRKCSLTVVPPPAVCTCQNTLLKGLADRAAGWRSTVVVRKPRTLPAVTEADAEDTGSAAESAHRALHHLRNLGDGRAGLRMRLQRAHVFFRPRLDDATCRLRLRSLSGLRALTSLLQSSRHYSGTPFERGASRYAMWRQKGRLFDVLNSE
jgi:hypothetical protein